MAFTDDAPVHLLKKKARQHRKGAWVQFGKKKIYMRSEWEIRYARYLEWLRDRCVVKSWKYEPKTFWFPKIKRGVRSFKPDFFVKPVHGTSYYVEVKGWMDKRSATKLKRMAKYYPKIVIRVIGKDWFSENTF